MHPPPLARISVVIRSMGRSCLHEAIASVDRAAFIPLEVVVVSACGGNHPVLPVVSENITLRLVNDGDVALGRAAAANHGILASQGECLLFLDDDDLIDTDHLARLFACLEDHPLSVAAYTGVRLSNEHGDILREQNEPWEPERLLGMNFLPIHSVMFRSSLVRGRLHFDPNLQLMEDWDFWCRLAAVGDFTRLPGCSATYRLGHGESGLSGARDKSAMYVAHSLVVHKISAMDGTAISRALFWFDTALAHVQEEKKALVAALASSNRYIALLEDRVRMETLTATQLRSDNDALRLDNANALLEVDVLRHSHHASNDELSSIRQALQATQGELLAARNECSVAQDHLTLMLKSKSWRLTAPLRALVTTVRQRGRACD